MTNDQIMMWWGIGFFMGVLPMGGLLYLALGKAVHWKQEAEKWIRMWEEKD